MSSVLDAIAAFFERHDWPVDHLDDFEGMSITSVNGDNGSWPLVVGVVGYDPEYLFVQSVVPPIAPAGDEVSTLELLARMNDGLVAGCFELNFDDGTIRLRSSMPIGALADVDQAMLVDLVDELVTANVVAADRFIPAIEAVIDGGVAPAIAVALVEAGLDPTA